MVDLEVIIGATGLSILGISNLCKYIDESRTICKKPNRIKYIQDRKELDKMSRENLAYEVFCKVFFGAGKKLAFWQYVKN